MKSNTSAFTLIEIVIALLVLAVGLIGILSLFPVGFDALGRSSNITKATFLAQKDIEEAKRLGYGNVVAIGTKQPAPAPYAEFDHRITVNTDPDWDEVTVEVSWPVGLAIGDQRSISITTYIADYEP